MINSLLKPGMLCIFLCSALALHAQQDDKSILVTVETLERDYQKTAQPEAKISKTNKKTTASFYRHHKKLAQTFEGYAIELTTADFPLSRNYHLFEQFGQVYYDRIEGKGYSYLILADFSSKKSIETYIKNVISYKAPEAILVEYKKGKRVK